MMESAELMKLEEAADLTNISKHCIKYLIRQGKVKSVVQGAETLVDVQRLRWYKDVVQMDE